MGAWREVGCTFSWGRPGAGKTFAMLEEGQRLRRDGVDVVVGAVSVRGRSETAALLEGLERCPAPSAGLGESDLDVGAVLERAPAVVLVDEYAGAAGSAGHGRERWQDVAVLLDAGIDVVSTLDVRNIESLSDIVQRITGSGNPGTVPDVAVRAAEQIELVDAPPEVLRERLGQGKIYGTHQRVDAALAGEFRTESLAAMRELALVWLADRVEEGLAGYRAAEGKEALAKREKIVVGLSGGPEGTVLVRRAARLLAGSVGGEFHAVHVRRSSDDDGSADKELERLRKLANDLGGDFHVVGGDDVPEVLLQFAVNGGASQLLLGARRDRPRASAAEPWHGSCGTPRAWTSTWFPTRGGRRARRPSGSLPDSAAAVRPRDS